MKPRVCVCCGEPISEKGNASSRNPNMSASCSSLADGLVEAERPDCAAAKQQRSPAGESPAEIQNTA